MLEISRKQTISYNYFHKAGICLLPNFLLQSGTFSDNFDLKNRSQGAAASALVGRSRPADPSSTLPWKDVPRKTSWRIPEKTAVF